MGTVYLGYDPRFEREVAIKVLTPQLLEKANLRARFEREAKTVAALEHPAIVSVYDFDEVNGQPYLVMQYMTGGTLADRLQHGPLPAEEAARILNRIGSALDEAHRRGIVHRDLKPGNILFDRYDNSYLTDFGIVSLAENAGDLTGTSTLGTPGYMSPEQIQGQTIDGRTDVYSLGVLAFEMLTGRKPFEGDTPAMILVKQMTEAPPGVHQLRPDLPPAVDQVLERTLTRDKNQRPDTAGELAAMIAVAAQAAPGVNVQSAPAQAAPVAPTAPPARPATPPAHTAAIPQPTAITPAGRKGVPLWLIVGAALVGLLICGAGVAAAAAVLNNLRTASTTPEDGVEEPAAAADVGDTEPVAAASDAQSAVEILEVANGTVYHVAVDGDDSNAGSSDAPWATIQHAVDSISPGDTIWVHEGTYAGARIEQSGEPEAWMVLMAAPDEEAILDAPGPNNKHESILELESWEGETTVNYWVVDGLRITGAPGWGVDMRGNEDNHSHHLVIRNNKVFANGWEGGHSGIFTAFVDDVLIEYNESNENGEHGIYLSNSGDRPIVRGNRLSYNANCGLHINGDISMGGDGIISDGLVEDNLIYENGAEGGCSAINMDGVTGATVRNNMLFQNHAGGIALFRDNGAACSHDNRILFNTIVQAADARWAISVVDFQGDGSECANNHFYGNILYNYHEWRGSFELQRPDFPGMVSDFNVMMDRVSVDEGDSVMTLAEWQALGYDSRSIIAGPDELFVDPAGGDYTLLPNAPAIDAAEPLEDVPQDFEGDARPAGAASDIGADEWTTPD